MDGFKLIKRQLFALFLLACLVIPASSVAWMGVILPGGGVEEEVGVCTGSLHCDDWECNNLTTCALPDAWDGSSTDGGDLAVAAGPGFTGGDYGSYCVKHVLDDTNSVYVDEAYSSDNSDWYVFTAWGINDITDHGAYKKYRVFHLDNTTENSGQTIRVNLQTDNTPGPIINLQVEYNNGSNNVAAALNPVPSANTWYEIKVRIKDEVGDGDGIIQAWSRAKGGSWNLIINNSTINFNVAWVGVGYVAAYGYYNNYTSTDSTFYFDDFGSNTSDLW